MAQQLHAAGEKVGLLAFFDAGSPSYPRFPKKQAQWKHKVSVHLISLTLKNPQEKMTYLWRRTINRLQVTLLPVVGNLLQKLKIRLPHSVRYVVVRKTLIDATNRYRAGSYPGEITIFRAKIQPVGCIPDPTMGLGEHVSGHIDVVEIEGNHNTMMKDKYMRLVAAGLKDRIH
jgi:thioesterase domain-containing protein